MLYTQIITTWLNPNAWFKAKVVVLRSNKHLIETRLANGFLTRLRGLLFAEPLRPAEGLLITPCNSIHTVGMAYAIDVVFLSPDMQIVHIEPNCQPYRFVSYRHAKHTLELLAGQATALNLSVGMQLSMQPIKIASPKQTAGG